MPISSLSDASQEEVTTANSSSSHASLGEEITSSSSSSDDSLGEEALSCNVSHYHTVSEDQNRLIDTSGRVSATLNTDGVSVHDMVCIIQHLRAELAAGKASQKADREHFKIEIDSLNTTMTRIQDVEAKLKVCKDKETKTQCNFSEKTSMQAAPPTPKTSSPSNPPADGGASGKEPSVETLMPKTSPLSNPPAAGGAVKEHSVKRIQNLFSNDNTNHSSKPSNRENEGRCNNHEQQAEVLTVLPDTTLLYIGDSVFSDLHEEKMGCSERDKSQVIFTSGLTLTALISKLSKPVQPSRKSHLCKRSC